MNLNNIEIQSILNGSYLYIFVIFIVLITTLLIILRKNILKNINSLGIILGCAGTITAVVSYIVPTILNLFSDMLSNYMMIINPVVDTFMEKLLFIGLGELITGLVLFIFSVALLWKSESKESDI